MTLLNLQSILRIHFPVKMACRYLVVLAHNPLSLQLVITWVTETYRNLLYIFGYPQNLLYRLYNPYKGVLPQQCQQKMQTETQTVMQMSRVMRKPTFCICENKDADQLRSYREADLRLCFRYTDSTIPLLSKFVISSI